MAAEASARADAASARVAVLRGTLVPQARHLVEATRVAFENGQGSLAEALDAQVMLLEAQLDEARAMRELELARVELETALGSERRGRSSACGFRLQAEVVAAFFRLKPEAMERPPDRGRARTTNRNDDMPHVPRTLIGAAAASCSSWRRAASSSRAAACR